MVNRKNELGLPSYDYERLFDVWRHMNDRCYKPESDRYNTYGARGITVCDEWKNNFRVFAKWAHENGWRVGLSIERKDVNGNYCPQNCCFITMKEQCRNTTRNIRLQIGDSIKCLTEWCEIYDVSFKTVWARLKSSGYRDVNHLFYKGHLNNKIEVGESVKLVDSYGEPN